LTRCWLGTGPFPRSRRDAGPGAVEAPAELPAEPAVHVCGDATGVNAVVGVGLGCTEAFDVAAKAVLARNAAG
jgi:hypothetical protein